MTAPVVLGSRFACPICGQRGGWQVGESRFCRDHVMDELERLYAETPHPFTPPLVVPVGRVR